MKIRLGKNKTKSILLIAIIILTVNVFTGCVQDELILDEVEVREYQGEKLSSVNDFRENSIKGPQYIDEKNYTLKITGLVEDPKIYSYEEIVNSFTSYKKVVTLFCVEGWNTKILWKGILVSDIIEESKPTSETNIIIFHAYDGYTTSLSLDYIVNNSILIAYEMNNVTSPPERGFPFQLVAESKWGYKWIKWITEIELSDDIDYKGFWESRGYSNKGDLNESYFD
jgi:DMSO/TMAO reductase YedYZ molybdopterin-dependent catalytic subunit